MFTPFLQLNERWRLAFDKNQWILQRRRAPARRGGAPRWTGEAFVASHKDILRRVLREEGVIIDDAAQDYIDQMPHRFLDWIAMPPAERFKGGHSALLIPSVPMPPCSGLLRQDPPRKGRSPKLKDSVPKCIRSRTKKNDH